MNAFTKRVIESIRKVILDHFLLFSEKQIQNIITEYIYYSNYLRTHQGIRGIPKGSQLTGFGKIKKKPVLGGLHYNYYCISA